MDHNATAELKEDIVDAVTPPTATRRVAGAAHELIDDAAEKAEAAELKLRDAKHQASAKVEASQEAASQRIEQSTVKVEQFIKERPAAAAGIAFAAGVLVSAVLRR